MDKFLKKFGMPLLGLGMTLAGWVYSSYKEKQDFEELKKEVKEEVLSELNSEEETV